MQRWKTFIRLFSVSSVWVSEMRIIDTHCHLNDERLYSIASEVIERARQNGVEALFNTGDSLDSFFRIAELKERFPDVCHSVLGIHPEYAGETDEYFSKAYSYLREHRSEIEAIGEIGLDYHYQKDEITKNNQKRRFVEQIRLSKELNLPIVIHSRDADYDTYSIVKEERPIRLDLHCYSGSYELLNEYLRLGIDVYIGIGGVSTFKNAKTIQEVITKTDISRFLTETDCPYLAPVPHRGETNEPAYLIYVINRIAELKNMNSEEVSEILFENAKRFYGK